MSEVISTDKEVIDAYFEIGYKWGLIYMHHGKM